MNASTHRNREREKIDRILDLLLISISTRSSFRRFVEDIKRQWQEEGWLSKKQKEVIEDAYRREVN